MNLDRLAGCNRQPEFLIDTPNWFCIQISIVSNLDPAETHRFIRSCMALFIEQKDLLLSGTALRLQYSASGFTVPTPPLQPFLPLIRNQGGGDGDPSDNSDDFSARDTTTTAWDFEHIEFIQIDVRSI